MDIECTVQDVQIEGMYRRFEDGVMVTCPRCDYRVSTSGTGPGSIRSCLATLRRECPMLEANFYLTEDER